jgi:hypothetical protein
MDLTKNRIMALATTFIFLAVYNVVVFVLPFTRGGNFWVGYAFSMFAMLLFSAVAFYVFGKPGFMSKFYRIPLLGVVKRYLILQLILGFIQMFLDLSWIPFDIGYQYALALNTIFLGLCFMGLITIEATKDEVERVEAKVREKVVYIRELQADVENLVGKVSDEKVKKTISEVAETIRYSVKMSSPQLAGLENKIEGKVIDLSDAVEGGDADKILALCDELQKLLAERNRKCKLLK